MMQPTHEQIQRLEKYLDILESLGITGEFSDENEEGFRTLIIWQSDNPTKQVKIGSFTDYQCGAYILVMSVLASMTGEGWDLVNQELHDNYTKFERFFWRNSVVWNLLKSSGFPVKEFNG